jgi:hypothetical protein
MSATLWTALLFQLTAVLLLRHRLGKLWLRRPATLLVLASVVYQGISAVLLAFPSVRYWDNFRNGLQQSYVDSATMVMSAGMLAFTVAYLLTRPERAVASVAGLRDAGRALDWRWLVLACLPLAVLTFQGRGYNDAIHMDATTATGTRLASTFFVIMVLVTAFSVVLRFGRFLPVLAGQSLLLAAAGERSPIITDAIALILMLVCAGARPSRRQLRTAVAVTVMGILAITGVRAEQGRSLYYTDSGITARVTALGSGLATLLAAGSEQDGQPGLLSQAAERLDGDAFAGAIYQARALGAPELSTGYVPASLLVTVPSAAWPAKYAAGDALDPVVLETDDYELQQTNFLPTFTGLYSGLLSPWWLVVFLAGCGPLLGWAERWLFRSVTPARLVLLAGAVIGALRYEQGLPGMLVALRAAIAIAIAVKAVEVLLVRQRSVKPLPSADTYRTSTFAPTKRLRQSRIH